MGEQRIVLNVPEENTTKRSNRQMEDVNDDRTCMGAGC